VTANSKHAKIGIARTILQDHLREHFNQAYPDRRVKEISVVHDTQKVLELDTEKSVN